MLEHGGRLRAAAEKFGVPLEQWIDLSTGISPWLYPVPAIPDSAWHRLPEPDDALNTIASKYYDNPRLLATAGSQPVIQALPSLFPRSQVQTCRNKKKHNMLLVHYIPLHKNMYYKYLLAVPYDFLFCIIKINRRCKGSVRA
ncbi:MAG: hypothetical protein ACKOAC_07715, partial [Fluviibacter sp.]